LRCLLICLTAVLCLQLTAAPVRADEVLVLRLFLNNELRGDYFVVRTDPGDFLIKKADLESFRLAAPEGRQVQFEGEPHISLRSLPALQLSFDEKALTLSITAPLLPPPRTIIDLNPPPPQLQSAYHPRETSAFLNYGLTYSHRDSSGFQSFTATDKLGLRAGNLLFLTDSQYSKTEEEDSLVRLMSNLTYERRQDLQWLVGGDMLASSGEMGSSINLGGIGLTKVYRMDPYLTRQPTFNFVGVAPTASQVELYLDGILVNKQNVLPGEFELKNFNYYGGGRRIEVIIRDPYGNEQRFSNPMYFSDLLLQEGLHEYSYNLGFLREEYGLASNLYGKLAFSAFHRYGVNNSLNLGAGAEGTEEITNTTVQVSQLFPRAGVVSTIIAGSRENSELGAAASLTHTLQFRQIGTNFRLRGFTRDYVTITPQPTEERTRYEAQAGVNLSSLAHGSISLGYSVTEKYSGATQSVGSATYSRSLSKTLWSMLTARAIHDATDDFEIIATLNYIPASNHSCNVRYQHSEAQSSGAVQLQKNTPVGEGFGYRANLEHSRQGASDTTTINPYGQYNGPYGIYSTDATLQWLDGDYTGQINASAAGSLLYAGGFVELARPVSDSFSLVFADGLTDVKVLLNNQEIGQTNRSGRLVIPNLSSYHLNQVSMDSANIAMDYSLAGVSANVSPSPWSGSCLSFGVTRLRAVTGMLTVRKGAESKPLEFIEVAMVVGHRTLTIPTGKGGEFYFENTFPEERQQAGKEAQNCRAIAKKQQQGRSVIEPGTYQATANYEGQTCSLKIIVPTTDDAITDLGLIECDLSPRP
jgi:outer membrane usher protein